MTEQPPPQPQVPAQGYMPPPAQFQPPPPGYLGPGYGPPPPGSPPGYRPPPPPGYRYLPLSPSGQPLASFADRLLAYLVDAAVAVVVALILAIPAFILIFAFAVPDPEDTLNDTSGLSFLLPFFLVEAGLFVVIFALSYVYYVEWVIRHNGQTVGKRVMKLRIVPLDPAATLDRGMAAKRWLLTQGCALVPGLSYLDGLWQLWDKPYQQCLHDKWPRTTVIKVPG